MKKNLFVDRHKQSDKIEDCKRLLNKIEELKLYLIELNENSKIKDKTYFLDCTISNKDHQPIIVITYN